MYSNEVYVYDQGIIQYKTLCLYREEIHYCIKWIESGEYNPFLDVARSPFNGSFLHNTHIFSPNALNGEDPQSDLKN